jgi:hypothetical protein
MEGMVTCDYYPTKSDSCLFIKSAEGGEPISFVIMYVDDGGIIGNPDAMKELIEDKEKIIKPWVKWENLLVVTSLIQSKTTESGIIIPIY